MMMIREEKKNDYPVIYNFIKKAFETAKVKDGDEQDFAERLRINGNYIPKLALVAEIDGEIVGHIMLTKTYVETKNGRVNVLIVAPLSVLLEHRSKKIGAKLMEEGLKRARELGYTSAFLMGDPAYYNRFGFKATRHFGISCSIDLPEDLLDCVMALELTTDALKGVNGIVNFNI